MKRILNSISLFSKHFFHVVSNVRPLVWICSYIGLIPVFAFIYWLLPSGQFRFPDNAEDSLWSFLYYSVVTISTLGFGDFTPAGGMAQLVTAIEVMCGLAIFGFFLNAVSSMKSYREPGTRREKRRRRNVAVRERRAARLSNGRRNLPETHEATMWRESGSKGSDRNS